MKRSKKHQSKKSIKLICAVIVLLLIIGALFVVEALHPGAIPFLSDIFVKDTPPSDNNGVSGGNNTVPAYIDIKSSLKIYFIDVGQGDSILLRFPDGVDVLVDAGSGTSESASRTSDYLSALSKTGLNDIEYLIATHPDSDHINMLDDVLVAYEVENIYYNGYIHSSKAFESFAKAAGDEQYGGGKDTPVTLFDGDGDVYTLLDTMYKLTVYAPGYERFGDTNAMSPIIVVEYEGKKIVLTGDAETETEEWFISTYGEDGFDADILKVGHHGSDTSSSQAFLDYINCEYAVISAAGNKYGHPHTETLTKLSAKNCSVYRTDISGTITVYIDGDGDMAFIKEKGH